MEERNPNNQYTPTCCVDRRKRIPQLHAIGCWGWAWDSPCSKVTSEHHFALNALERVTNQRAALEACAAALMALDCKLEVRLDSMCFKTGVEQMLSWIERKMQPNFRSCANPKTPCYTQTCPSSSLLVRCGGGNPV